MADQQDNTDPDNFAFTAPNNDDEDRVDTTASDNFDYGSNIRLTDDPMPQDIKDSLPPDHPVTDAARNIDSHELYDAGADQAHQAHEPGLPDA